MEYVLSELVRCASSAAAIRGCYRLCGWNQVQDTPLCRERRPKKVSLLSGCVTLPARFQHSQPLPPLEEAPADLPRTHAGLSRPQLLRRHAVLRSAPPPLPRSVPSTYYTRITAPNSPTIRILHVCNSPTRKHTGQDRYGNIPKATSRRPRHPRRTITYAPAVCGAAAIIPNTQQSTGSRKIPVTPDYAQVHTYTYRNTGVLYRIRAPRPHTKAGSEPNAPSGPLHKPRARALCFEQQQQRQQHSKPHHVCPATLHSLDQAVSKDPTVARQNRAGNLGQLQPPLSPPTHPRKKGCMWGQQPRPHHPQTNT